MRRFFDTVVSFIALSALVAVLLLVLNWVLTPAGFPAYPH